MSNITTVFDAIVTNLATLFPSKTRIPYPYSLSDNNARFLCDGYGVAYGASTFEQFQFCDFLTIREVNVVFTREVFRTDSDAVKIDDITKALLEDVYNVQSLFYSYNELGVESSIAKVDLGSVSGVEEVNAGKQSFLSMTASFNFGILERL